MTKEFRIKKHHPAFKNAVLLCFLLILGVHVKEVRCFSILPKSTKNINRSPTFVNMNFLSDLGDFLSGGKLVSQTSIPYDPPFCPSYSICTDRAATFAIQERALSFTGEDFDIYCPEQNAPIITVRGAMLHLPGKDKMRIYSEGDEVLVLDRVKMAMSPTYDIYRGGMFAEKIGWIEKKIATLTETFDVYMEGAGGVGLFKPPPVYEITGNFFERNFVMKNNKNEVVAKVSKVSFGFLIR